ncbi:hypothetical protein GJ496_000282 [Pomphorhynchus laevis]|nr:hypothetical protein GJ496_000282 [Pomphorhynchus laevis]
MATVDMMKKPAALDEGRRPKMQCIRITLSSSNVTSIEKVANALLRSAKANNLRIRGPVPLPVKILRITTRKTPCGEGSKTWDHFQMRIHKRLIDLYCPQEQVQGLQSIIIEPDVISEVIVRDV